MQNKSISTKKTKQSFNNPPEKKDLILEVIRFKINSAIKENKRFIIMGFTNKDKNLVDRLKTTMREYSIEIKFFRNNTRAVISW